MNSKNKMNLKKKSKNPSRKNKYNNEKLIKQLQS